MSLMPGGSSLLRVVAALAAAPPLTAQQPPGAWDSVARALGRSGPAGGETYRATFPRTDLQVSVSGARIAPALALTSWAAFAGSPDSADVMGDLVLAENEVADVVAALLDGGLDVTAIHHHLLGESPRVLYLHYHGRGRGVVLATKLRVVLARTATPFEAGPAPRTPNGAPRATLDTAAIFETLGVRGRLVSDVAQFGIATSGSRVTLAGRPVPLALGMATALNLQPLSASRALATGDFVLSAERVAPVIQALTAAGIHVTALHNHLVGERSEEHTSELQSQSNIVCRLLLEKKKNRGANAQPQTDSKRFEGNAATTCTAHPLANNEGQDRCIALAYVGYVSRHKSRASTHATI